MQRQEKNVSRIIVNSSIWSLDFALACQSFLILRAVDEPEADVI